MIAEKAKWTEALQQAIQEDRPETLVALLSDPQNQPPQALVIQLLTQTVPLGRMEMTDFLLKKFTPPPHDRMIELAYQAQQWETAMLLLRAGYPARVKEGIAQHALIKTAPLTYLRTIIATGKPSPLPNNIGHILKVSTYYAELLMECAQANRADVARVIIYDLIGGKSVEDAGKTAASYLLSAAVTTPSLRTLLKTKKEFFVQAGIIYSLSGPAHAGRLQEVKELLSYGASPNNPPGMLAGVYINDHKDVLQALLEAGGNVWSGSGALLQLTQNFPDRQEMNEMVFRHALQGEEQSRKQFESLFGQNPSLQKLRTGSDHTVTSSTPTPRLIDSFSLAAQAGIFNSLLERARQGPHKLDPYDLLAQEPKGVSALNVLWVRGEHMTLADWRLWHRPEEYFKALAEKLPTKLRADFEKAAASQLQRMEAENHIAAIHAGIPKDKFKLGKKSAEDAGHGNFDP